MGTVPTALLAGAAGATTTNILHELVRRVTPGAPQIDLLGTQVLARALDAAGITVPDHGTLYYLTLTRDLLPNSGYFGLVGVAPGTRAVAAGVGVLAGLGAVYLPSRIGLSTKPTDRAAPTRANTVALYTAGGLVAGAAYQALQGER